MSSNYQKDVGKWMIECFGNEIASDATDRNYRFLEEALELSQSLGATKNDVLKLIEYVFSRPIGEPYQEVGGVSVTLAALCNANGLDLIDCADLELYRISQPDILEKIRIKQSNKPKGSPLPI